MSAYEAITRDDNKHLYYALLGACEALVAKHGTAVFNDCAVNNWCMVTFGAEVNEFKGNLRQFNFELTVEWGEDTLSLRMS